MSTPVRVRSSRSRAAACAMPKSTSLTTPDAIDHDVRRADVAMHDVQRHAVGVAELVREGERAGQLGHQVADDPERQRPLRRRRLLQQRRRLQPSMYSIARKYSSPSRPSSCTCTIAG